ncbi:MAG: phosphotransferase [Lachnospiraceae bacterium]|nr:phosphotransferase [Lachnospiraceae bacterium]
MKLQDVIATRSNKTIYRDGDKCIKVFSEGYNKADILNEALNQARVEETGLLIPKVLEVTMIDNKWAIVSEFIEGRTLQKMMDENPAKMDEYLDRFVSIQLDMHSRTCKKLSLLKDKMQLKISASELDATTRYELHTRLEGMHAHMKLCHGDFNPSNIIITKKDEAYIIDWAHATQGNASADAARTYLLFCLANKEDTAMKYLDVFCKKSDTARQYVQKWMPIVAASQSVKGNEQERDFLLRWANVVDYE